MKEQLTREGYKFYHQRLPWLMLPVLLVLMIALGIAMGRSYSRLLVMTCYDSSAIIMLLLVIVGSTSYSTEFQNRTILATLYHAPGRAVVFWAKFLVLLSYNCLLHLAALVFTVLLNLVPLVNARVAWLRVYQYGQPLVVNMLATTGVDLVTSGLILSLLCLMSCLINSNSVVIAVNAILVFMGSGFSANLLNAGLTTVVRWNPFNMLNLTNQYYNYATYHLTTHLTNGQLLGGTLAYLLLFLFLGNWAFAKKHF